MSDRTQEARERAEAVRTYAGLYAQPLIGDVCEWHHDLPRTQK